MQEAGALLVILRGAKRLPLVLAAASLGIGAVGLAVTLYQPTALSPFSPASQPAVRANSAPLTAPVFPEIPEVVLGGAIDAATPEATAEAAVALAVIRRAPAAPAATTAPPAATASPEPESPVAAAGNEPAVPLEPLPEGPIPPKDEAGGPPVSPYILPNTGPGKGDDSASAHPAPGIVASATPEVPAAPLYSPEPGKDGGLVPLESAPSQTGTGSPVTR